MDVMVGELRKGSHIEKMVRRVITLIIELVAIPQ